MGLRLPDKWVWDFWFAQDGDDTHIFYLQAPRDLIDQEKRHWNVSVGHAVSQDLRTWTILPDALTPAGKPQADETEAWDSYTTWTGSIVQHGSLWYMFYTGSSLAEDGLVQRVGLATSHDLITWKKHPNNPLIVTDPTHYELLDLDAWHDQAWRDPYLYHDGTTFHAFITARVKDGDADARGVIAHATSTDLVDWEVQPPITLPGEFGHMEVPQLLHINNRYYMLFSVHYNQFSDARKERVPDVVGGTHYLVANSITGPYEDLTDEFLVGDEPTTLYSGKMIQDNNGNWQFLAFKNFDAAGNFIGEIADPLPVSILPDGRLQVTRNA